jgi:hypothetical protein
MVGAKVCPMADESAVRIEFDDGEHVAIVIEERDMSIKNIVASPGSTAYAMQDTFKSVEGSKDIAGVIRHCVDRYKTLRRRIDEVVELRKRK